MAIRPNAPTERPDHTSLQAGSEGESILQSEKKLVNRSGATSAEADFDLDGFDLDASVFDLHNEKADNIGEEYPNTGGAGTMTIFLESTGANDREFSVEVEWIGDDGNVVGSVDQYVDSGLISFSPTNGVNYVYATVTLSSDTWNIKIVDEANAGQNEVSGSINIH